ncbi:MAG: DUF3783 domain-containing protein [Muribaculaceae bacterium]|nr:DUF3783 domain-containing protein [Roseburia sp.]MCM1430930.1 DUF3783 domain-containing protein [Muribaculaceae bacterium]MCM1491709.1 DUF3783 domain-containing protein [Muribaculaceae bacterium]
MSQIILTFQLDPQKDAAVQKICTQLGIQRKNILPKDYSQKLGYLAGVQGFSREKAGASMPFSAEMLVFSGMNSDQVDAFLDAYKKTALSPVRRKAVITPSNVFWTAEALFCELTKECRFH